MTRPEHDAREGALGPLLRALRVHKLLAVAVTLAAIAAAAALVSLRSPSYEATTQLLVAPLSQNDQMFLGVDLIRDAGDPTRTVQTAAAITESAAAAQATARRLGHGLTRQDVESAVAVQPLGESNVVAVTAKSDSAQLAADISTTYARQALALRATSIRAQIDAVTASLIGSNVPEDQSRVRALGAVRRRGDPTLTIAQPATRPDAPTGPSDWLVMVLAAIVGLVLASVAAVLSERFNRRVRELDDLINLYPLPVLTRVPAKRSGENSEDPFAAPPAVREAFRTLQIQLDQRRIEGRTVMITSATSGDGKTSVALNLALALVAAGHRVLLMDFDLRKPDLEFRLGLHPSQGLTSLLTQNTALADLVQHSPRLAPLTVVPAAGAPGDMALLPVLAQRMPAILDEASKAVDYIIIDTAPLGEVGDTLAITGVADDLILVGRPGNTDRVGLGLVRDLLSRAGTPPSGWVIVGDEEISRGTYYAYGTDLPNTIVRRRRPNS
ncbi:MAG: hypothetical protein JWM31_2184 [Solirubrobacterales bacterium]|nr:hypothetical protein [Solirubrobacterales bacterium]